MDYKQYQTNTCLAEAYNKTAKENDRPTVSIPWKSSRQKLEALFDELLSEVRAKPKQGTVRELALSLLCEVDYYEDKTQKSCDVNFVAEDHKNARSVGFPYLEIIDKIKEQFPDANTSVACLRWYAVKVRGEEFGYEGLRLVQRRPRMKKAKETATE